MSDQEPIPLLSTRDVAAQCGTTESTIRYAARTGTLRGTKVRNAWRFREAEARAFCDALQNRKASRRRRLALWRVPTRMRRAASTGIGLLHLAASVLSLVTAFQVEHLAVLGFLLAPLHAIAGVASFVWGWVRPGRSSSAATVDEPSAGDPEPIDPAVFDLRRRDTVRHDRRTRPGDDRQDAALYAFEGGSRLAVWPLTVAMTFVATLGYVTVATGEDRPVNPTPTSTAGEILNPVDTPTSLATFAPTAPPTELEIVPGATDTPTPPTVMPPATQAVVTVTVPPPTDTPLVITATAQDVTTPEVPPACDPDGCSPTKTPVTFRPTVVPPLRTPQVVVQVPEPTPVPRVGIDQSETADPDQKVTRDEDGNAVE